MSDFWIIFKVVGFVIIAYIISSILRGIYIFFNKEIIKKESGLTTFGKEVFYTDQKNIKRKENVIYSKMLVSEKYEIRGKPDFIYKSTFGGSLMPVELKSGAIGKNPLPYEGDLMQLVAYFIIIEEHFGIRPKMGQLVYRDYRFIVKNTSKSRKKVINTLCDMRSMQKDGKGDVTPTFIKCRNCMCNGTVCEYAESSLTPDI